MPWRWMTTALPILAGEIEDHTAKTVGLGRDVGKKKQRVTERLLENIKTIVYKCIIYCYNIISFWSCFFIITDECDIIYLCKYIQIKFISHSHALWMEYIRLLRTGIMSEYPVMSTSQGSYVRITNVWSDKSNIRNVQSGVREDWNENRCY